MKPSPRTALFLFVSIAVVIFAQAVWWIIFMAQLVNEKVDIATELGGTPEFVERIHEQEVSRQIMLGTEGIFFLLLVLAGAWLIYRALVKAEELKFHQQNFLMAVTHELKTPLASIRIYLDSLISPKISAERKEQMVPRMKEDIVRLEKLVENILDAGRLDRQGYHLEMGDVELSGLLNRALDDLERIPLSRKLVIIREIQDDVVMQGDHRALRRALDAVLENCIKYNDNEVIEIAVRLNCRNKAMVITVKDNGIGLRKEDTTTIFDRFYRVGQEINRSRPGSGLGLYLSREIIRAHGGQMVARSSGLGTGTEFEITLRCHGSDKDNITG